MSDHPGYYQTADAGYKDEDGYLWVMSRTDDISLGFAVLKAGVQRTNNAIIDELIQMVREKIGPIASFKVAIIVKRLPKTRSGKILRGTMKHIADGVEYRMPATIDDPAILDEITAALLALGYPHR